MTITRMAHPEALWPGIKAWFGQSYGEHSPQWGRVFKKKGSDKAYEKLVESTGFGLASIKAEGGSVSYDTDAQGIVNVLTPNVYGLGYIVTREEVEDNLYTEVSMKRSTALAFSMRQTAEIVHANVLNRAFNASYVGGDGVALCSNAHTTRSGNQSNLLVAADLSEAAIEDSVKVVRQATNARGLKVNIRPKRLIVHTDDLFNATRILQSDLRVGTANNDINAIKTLGSIPEIVDYVYLTDNDAWFVQTDAPEGLQSLWRREVDFDKDDEFSTENMMAKATMRFSTGWGDYRSIWGNPGS